MSSMMFSSTRPQPARRRIPSRNRGTKGGGGFSLSFFLASGMAVLMLMYVLGITAIAKWTGTRGGSNGGDGVKGTDHNLRPVPLSVSRSQTHEIDQRGGGAVEQQLVEYDLEEDVDVDADPHGDAEEQPNNFDVEESPVDYSNHPPERVLTAYVEPIDQSTWATTPLPLRTTTAQDLKAVEFPALNSCSRLLEQWPVDDFPDDDPFLPWIHDVFPSHDGKHIQFVAQNKRRCRTGTTEKEINIAKHMAPQVALFQHVAVKRIRDSNDEEVRYQLVPHAEADEDGMETRFICRFSNGQETLSVFNFSYEWASYRKKQNKMFHEDGRDNKQIHTSQLLFQCPVPEDLVETVRTGASVINDYATVFVDLVPIRTPPRYGPPNEFFPPYYKEFEMKESESFDAAKAWGDGQVMPKVNDSGRWANIPICRPSLLEYGKQKHDNDVLDPVSATKKAPFKAHKLVSCLWASSGYATRGERFAINDGQRRLLEWVTYNKLIGVEHFYLYDNSGAFRSDTSLQPIADMFPDDITVIKWPSKVCNNNKNNVDSVGERSSQYAAEASCRLRFGPHTEWVAQFDIDEYLVPMGELTSIHPLLDKLDEEGKKIVSFGSWRAWPRRRFIEDPNLTRKHGVRECGRNQDCFDLKVPMNQTVLQAYNCDRQKPGQKSEQMPAEKQIYRADYVLHHFIHYSTVTEQSAMNKEDIEKLGQKWNSRSPFPDPLSRFGDEITEALMLHTKSVATQDTVYWELACAASYDGQATCRLGTPWPEDMTGVNVTAGDEGWKFNCYVNHKIDNYWVKLLEAGLKDHVPEIRKKLDAAAA